MLSIKGTCFVFYQNKNLIINYNCRRYEEYFIVEVEFENGTSGKLRKATYQASVGKFFDEDGNLVSKVFYEELRAFFEKLVQDK